MNTITTTNPQSVSRILNAAGIKKSASYKGRITNMSSEGFEVTTNWQGDITVAYRQRTASMVSFADFKPTRDAAMANIETILTAKGYTVTAGDNHNFIITK
jgi:hypothetical protein